MGTGKVAKAGILDLIGQVYDAALDENLWPGLAPRMAHAFDSASAVLQQRHIAGGWVELLAATDNFDQASLESYASYYGRRDVWLERAATMGSADVLASKHLISDRELERTEFYQDFLRTRGAFHVVGAGFPISGDTLCVIGIHRPREGRPYDEVDKRGVAEFLPHLGRALEIKLVHEVSPCLSRQCRYPTILDPGRMATEPAGRHEPARPLRTDDLACLSVQRLECFRRPRRNG